MQGSRQRDVTPNSAMPSEAPGAGSWGPSIMQLTQGWSTHPKESLWAFSTGSGGFPLPVHEAHLPERSPSPPSTPVVRNAGCGGGRRHLVQSPERSTPLEPEPVIVPLQLPPAALLTARRGQELGTKDIYSWNWSNSTGEVLRLLQEHELSGTRCLENSGAGPALLSCPADPSGTSAAAMHDCTHTLQRQITDDEMGTKSLQLHRCKHGAK